MRVRNVTLLRMAARYANNTDSTICVQAERKDIHRVGSGRAVRML